MALTKHAVWYMIGLRFAVLAAPQELVEWANMCSAAMSQALGCVDDDAEVCGASVWRVTQLASIYNGLGGTINTTAST
jgi:hypothetical protein